MKLKAELIDDNVIVELPEGYRLRGELCHDQDAGPPWEEWDGEGVVVQIERGLVFKTDKGRQTLDAFLKSKFGSSDIEPLEKLARGEVVVDTDGYPCLGIEAYIHSGEVWYLPGQCQIDRRWDVAPLRAIWTADADVLSNVTVGGVRPTCEALREYLKNCLACWNQFLSGDVWVVSVFLERQYDDDPDGDWQPQPDWDSSQDTAGDLYGVDAAKEYVEELAMGWVRERLSDIEEQQALIAQRRQLYEPLVKD